MPCLAESSPSVRTSEQCLRFWVRQVPAKPGINQGVDKQHTTVLGVGVPREMNVLDTHNGGYCMTPIDEQSTSRHTEI